MAQQKRIGLFGGSFNPIHNGHLHLLEVAKRRLGLESVILLPAAVSPFKQNAVDMASAQDRFTMCQLAAEALPYCTVDAFELERQGVSYSIYTAEHFHAQFPTAQLVWLMGSDMFLQFQNWFRWQDFLQLSALGVLARRDADRELLVHQKQKLSPYGDIFLCNAPVFAVSSTEIREKRKKNEDFSCYLPEKVVQYIISHRLYETEQNQKQVPPMD